MSTNLMQASSEWARRPDDQRYMSLDELHQAVLSRRNESWTVTPKASELRMVPKDGSIGVEVFDPTVSDRRVLSPSNWAFTQLAGYAKAPASYLRTLPAELSAINLQWGLERNPQREDTLVLARSNGHHELRAMTSTSYGRIWDADVVKSVKAVNADGRWQIPAASYTTTNPRRATTLYASDRDVFIFLVDPKNAIEVDGEQLFRGFMAWNSEVGSTVFGLRTFLYRYVCDNRIVWGATEVRELKIRHTGGAPQRFAYEGARYLKTYAEESTARLVAGIRAAQQKDIPSEEKTPESVAQWLRTRGFTQAEAKGAVESAQAEEGQVRTLWDVVNGVTAYARSVPFADERVNLELRAGQLMEAATR